MRKIGILGGGQLGKMLAQAGSGWGWRTYCYDPSPTACARDVAQLVTAGWQDKAAIAAFCDEMDLITYETENLPVETVAFLRACKGALPLACLDVLAIAQDRLLEKQFFRSLGARLPAFHAVNSLEDADQAFESWGQQPMVLKTRRSGYDGKGQYVVHDVHDWQQLRARWDTQFAEPADLVAERWCPFEREWSLIGVRNAIGEVRFYDLCCNVHQNGILQFTTPVWPGMDTAWDCWKDTGFAAVLPRLPDSPTLERLQQQAQRVLSEVFAATGYTGILTVEFFECEGEMWVNEMAPRVHNSGHWTVEGAYCSQFANHWRALMGWPLGDTRSRCRSLMVNCIGTLPAPEKVLLHPRAYWHAYGKEPRAARKMGHVTYVK